MDFLGGLLSLGRKGDFVISAEEAIDRLIEQNKDNRPLWGLIGRCESSNDFMEEVFFIDGEGINGFNALGLQNQWRKSGLTRWFNKRGIHCQDTMSWIILLGFYRRASGEDVKMMEMLDELRC